MKLKSILGSSLAVAVGAWSSVALADRPLQICLWQNGVGAGLCLAAHVDSSVTWESWSDSRTWWLMSEESHILPQGGFPADPLAFSTHQHAKSGSTGQCLAFGGNGGTGPMSTTTNCTEGPTNGVFLASSFENGQITSGHQGRMNPTQRAELFLNVTAAITAGTTATFTAAPNLSSSSAAIGINGKMLIRDMGGGGLYDVGDGTLHTSRIICYSDGPDGECIPLNTAGAACGFPCWAKPVWAAVGRPAFDYPRGYMDLGSLFGGLDPQLDGSFSQDPLHADEMTFLYASASPILDGPDNTPGGIYVQSVDPGGFPGCLNFDDPSAQFVIATGCRPFEVMYADLP